MQDEYKLLQDKESRARQNYFRKRDLSHSPNLPPLPIDDGIKNQSIITLKNKWVKRTENRRKQKTLMQQRTKELAEFKAERNVHQRKEGEVWRCGDTYKMEWTHSP